MIHFSPLEPLGGFKLKLVSLIRFQLLCIAHGAQPAHTPCLLLEGGPQMLGSLPSEFIIVGWFVYCRVAYGISSSSRGSQILSKKTEVSGFSTGVGTSQKKVILINCI